MADTIQLQSIQQLHSETASAKPSADVVEVGQLWINLADNTIGSKKSDGTIVTYGQLTEEERDTLLSGGGVYIPKQGVVEGITVSSLGSQADGDIVINDDSPVTITKTLTEAGVTITANKTTGCKATQIVLTKPLNVSCVITWTGVDSWLSTESEPIFGESAEAQELCIAIFTTPTHVAVNVIYNTENPSELDLSNVSWGNIGGTLANQVDLTNALNAKADTTALDAKAPLTNPAFTGTATLGGQNIATVNQIPDISGLATKSELSGYLPVGGTAASATKLATAHSFSIKGAVIGTAVSFDGTGDVAINATSATDATKIALSGSRGTLAGYENTSVTASALTVTQTSPDSQQVTAAVKITVNNGSANTAWVKKVSIKNTGVSIALGSAWSWVGGSQPTVTAPSLLVLSWDNDCGLAILNTTG